MGLAVVAEVDSVSMPSDSSVSLVWKPLLLAGFRKHPWVARQVSPVRQVRRRNAASSGRRSLDADRAGDLLTVGTESPYAPGERTKSLVTTGRQVNYAAPEAQRI